MRGHPTPPPIETCKFCKYGQAMPRVEIVLNVPVTSTEFYGLDWSALGLLWHIKARELEGRTTTRDDLLLLPLGARTIDGALARLRKAALVRSVPITAKAA